jgi:predicted RND superfamily exporter protein
MLEIYKRSWQVFFPLFGVFLLGAIQAYIFMEDYQFPVTITLLILATICLIIGMIALICHIRHARRKDKDREKAADRKALRESVKRLNPEYTEKQIDAWINGK